jgi:hypothetical protein
MEIKMLVLLMVSLLIIKLDSATIGPSKLRPLTIDDPNYTYEYAKLKIEELNGILNEKVITALGDFQELLFDLTDLMNGVAESGKSQIHDIYNENMEIVDSIRDQFVPISINITQCVDEGENQLNRLRDQLNNEMVICLTNGGNEATKVVYNVLSDVIIVPSVVGNLSAQLEFCGSDISMTPCVVEVLQDVLNNLYYLPERIDNGVQSANETVLSLEPVLTETAQTVVAQMSSDVNSIIDDLTSCFCDVFPRLC